MFVADAPVATSEITQSALAFRKIAECTENTSEYCGIYFYIPEEMEVVVGWQADLAHGSDTRGIPRGKGRTSTTTRNRYIRSQCPYF